ncbi:hypothetical protein EI94DRAFT_1807671 [Lactarius quietus]|nr:hypothetical protein EI94DRAFT_1807671 [Lactarius quietus]
MPSDYQAQVKVRPGPRGRDEVERQLTEYLAVVTLKKVIGDPTASPHEGDNQEAKENAYSALIEAGGNPLRHEYDINSEIVQSSVKQLHERANKIQETLEQIQLNDVLDEIDEAGPEASTPVPAP